MFESYTPAQYANNQAQRYQQRQIKTHRHQQSRWSTETQFDCPPHGENGDQHQCSRRHASRSHSHSDHQGQRLSRLPHFDRKNTGTDVSDRPPVVHE